MGDSSLYYMTIGELTEGYRSRKFSPVEVVESYLDRIGHLNDRLGAFISVADEQAGIEARQAEKNFQKGSEPGELEGIPIGLKDLIDTKTLPTTWGANFRRGVFAEDDAVLVKGLLQQGAIIIGKHNLLEFAMGGIDYNPHYGVIRNPWNLERFAGGSSSGTAAAVAAGLCAGGVGTDTGGSVRQPSSHCGITGLKTTHGLVSVDGVFPLGKTADTAGPMARSAEDAAIILGAMVGDSGQYISPLKDLSLDGVRIGVDRAWVEEGTDDEVFDLWAQALLVLKDLGAALIDITIPEPKDLRNVYRDIVNYEAFNFHKELFRLHGHEYGPEALRRMESGQTVTDEAHKAALKLKKEITARADGLFQTVDAIAFPTQPTTAPLLGSEMARFKGGMTSVPAIRARFSHFASFTGFPGLTVPIGFNSEGLPAGLQIVRPAFGEALGFRVGHAYQQSTDWHKYHPDMDSPGAS
jgi:aspartyl-tRNA(Asn)/glutamyl-tRNA(Gln) amidotransferase subunit A